MPRRSSLLQKLWRKLRKRQPAAISATPPPPPRKTVSSLEPLEGRISPAALINPTTLVFKDADNDIVTVKFSKALFKSTTVATNVDNAKLVFGFDTGTVDSNVFNAATAPAQQLRLIDLTKVPLVGGLNPAAGVGISVTVVKAGGGNGVADIGYIKATGLPLGAVSLPGDLGQIDAGVATSAIGLASLKVKSLGARLVTETQGAGGDLRSSIIGSVNSLSVKGDVNGAAFVVANAGSSPGKIGSVTIGGSLKGSTAADSGLISATFDIGAVKVGTLPTDGIFGGAGTNSGRVISDGKIASVTVTGDIVGGNGLGSGTIHARGTLGPVVVKGTVAGGGNVLGGGGQDSGSISASGIGAITIFGSLKAGSNDTGSGVISSLQNIGLVKINGSLDGSNVSSTIDSIGVGGIRASGKIAGVTILGSLTGGAEANSGFIDAGTDLGPVIVGAITGGAGTGSGTISAGGKITSLLVKGDITGGGGDSSGAVFSGVDSNLPGDLGLVKVGGKITGAGGNNSGSINSGGKIAGVSVGPAVPSAVAQMTGGMGAFSGAIVAYGSIPTVRVTGGVEGGGGEGSGSIFTYDLITDDAERAGDLGIVTITGHLMGGGNTDSGVVSADGKIGSVTTGDLLGGAGVRSGSIRAGQGSINTGTGMVTIKGNMVNGSGPQTAAVIAEGKITGVLVTGEVHGGTIRAGDNIGAITVNKFIDGGTNVQGTQFSARGQAIQGATTDLAIGRVTVLGDVTQTRIRAGYDTSLTNPVNPDAQIGSVYVKGNWTRSDIFAGVIDGGATGFGTVGDVKIPGTDNPKIVSQIASIIIGKNVFGTAGAGDHFGFVAQKLVAVKVGTTMLPLHAAIAEEAVELLAATTNDVTALEVPI